MSCLISFLRPQILEEQIPDTLRNNLRHKVQRLCAYWRVLPAKLLIQGKLEYSEDITARGGFSEVRRGTYKGEEVAVKCIRFNQHVTSEKIMRVSGTNFEVQAF